MSDLNKFNFSNKLQSLLVNSPELVKSQLSFKLDDAFRTAVVKFGDRQFNARLMNLPCIVESLKTHDKKSFYKVGCRLLKIQTVFICFSGDRFMPNSHLLTR